ncbi:DUF397 domain-containing protein [Streptomyces sp. F63]|uniref:DUF397 domain-containing protein n=1 Tax=Streptomyces sp. F63 TaxID=2824887 RepID=UPI001B36A686|nr:DUF397 domain-containing protein [Streptomyces sp. F63]MBQ0987755.1 DUF397 domain-containing protein [Streptomyces sp. F63]
MADFVFVKSSYSGGNAGQECVEVAANIPGTVAIRDSKSADGPILRVTAPSWAAFTGGLASAQLRHKD